MGLLLSRGVARDRLRRLAEIVRPVPPGVRRGVARDFLLALLGFWTAVLVIASLPYLVACLLASAAWRRLTGRFQR